jgi:hypothetical protein
VRGKISDTIIYSIKDERGHRREGGRGRRGGERERKKEMGRGEGEGETGEGKSVRRGGRGKGRE